MDQDNDHTPWDDAFESEVGRLTWLVGELDSLFASGLRPSTLSEENFDVFVVCTAWIRLAASYARATLLMADDELADAAFPTARALYELWGDFLYLLDHGDRLENARKVEASAVLELDTFLRNTGDDFTAAEIAGVARESDRIRRQHPQIIQRLEAHRRARRFHWSGLSRTQVLKAALGDVSKQIYRIHSWDAHAVMTAIRDLEPLPEMETITFRPLADSIEAAEQLSYQVGGVMYNMWNRYSEEFGLPGIDPLGSPE